MASCTPAEPAAYPGRAPLLNVKEVPPGFDGTFSAWIRKGYRWWTAETVASAWSPSGGGLSAWEGLASAADNALANGTGYSSGETEGLALGSFSRWGLGADYFLVVSALDNTVQPVGPRGPTLWLKAGFHLFQYICAGSVMEAAEVPPDTMLPWSGSSSPLNCGESLASAPDLGRPLADVPSLPAASPYPNHKPTSLPLFSLGGSPVASLSWSPTGEDVYYNDGSDTPSLYRLHLADGTATSVARPAASNGGVLQVVTDGTTLLIVPVLPGGSWGSTTQVQIGDHAWPFSRRLSAGPPSPDGLTAAAADGGQLVLFDLSTGGSSVVHSSPTVTVNRALAFSPAGDHVWVAASDGRDASSGPYGTVSLSGSYTPLPLVPGELLSGAGDGNVDLYLPAWVHYLWTTSGPKFFVQDGQGAWFYDLRTQTKVVVVPPDRVAPPYAPIAALPTAEQVFAWTLVCQGLAETNCASELWRISLSSGQHDVVLAADGILPFAISPDGSAIVSADRTKLYVKTLGPLSNDADNRP